MKLESGMQFLHYGAMFVFHIYTQIYGKYRVTQSMQVYKMLRDITHIFHGS